jgi:type I restriction enzyme S subunit
MSKNLPKGWVECQISDIFELVNGKAFKPIDWKKSGYPIVRIQNLNNSKASYNYSDGKVAEKFFIENGELLFAWSGTPGTSFGAHIWQGPNAILNQHIYKMVFAQNLLNKVFLKHAINQKLNALIGSAQGGVGLRHVTKKTFEATKIPLSPLNEQKRIVAKLDRLLTHVDAARARLDSVAKTIKHFRQSVLNAAVTGQLTEDWREKCANNVDLSELDKQILPIESKQPNCEDFGYSPQITIPEEWHLIPLYRLGKKFSYGSSKKSSKKGLIPVLRMGNIKYNKLSWDDLVFTSDDEEIAKYLLKPGDVLFNRTNSPELVGKTAYYGKKDPKSIYAGYLIRVEPLDCLEPKFLTYCLNSSYGKNYCWTVKTDGVSQSNINAKKLGAFPIPFPSQKEQEEIVKRVEALFKLADSMEAKLEATRKRVETLTASILAKAFRGELVPQDPNDQPAAELLQQIKALKNEKSQTNKVGKK